MKHLFAIAFLSISLVSCSSQVSITVPVPPTNISNIVNPIEIHKFSSNDTSSGQQLAGEVKANILTSGYIKIVKNNGRGILKGNIEISPTTKDVHDRNFIDQNGTSRNLRIVTIKTHGFASYTLTDKKGNTLSSGTFRDEQKSTDTNITIPASGINGEHKSLILKALSSKITAAISPTQKQVSVKPKGGQHPGLAHGIKKMMVDSLDQAKHAFSVVIKETNRNSDKSAAYYNLGLIDEKRGSYQEAYKKYKKSNSYNRNEPAITEALRRVTTAMNNQKKILKSAR